MVYNEVNLQKGDFLQMAGTKITMSLSEKTLEMLEKLAQEKGVKKSAIVALAVEGFYREQKGESNNGSK